MSFTIKLLVSLEHKLMENVEVFYRQYVNNIFVIQLILEFIK